MHAHNRINSNGISNRLSESNEPVISPSTSQVSNTSTHVSLNISTTHSNRRNRSKPMFQIRRTFLLIVAFDVIFMVLLWIIYNQINGNAITKAFQNDVVHYSIGTSLFDVVGLSALRFILLMLPYAVLKSSHWIFVALTTLGSTGFIIAKTCLFTISKPDRSFGDYLILIVSFVLAWVEIWFFDYRVIPQEHRLREELNNGERQRLLSPITSRSSSPTPYNQRYPGSAHPTDQGQSFYSPVPSEDGSDIDDNNLLPKGPNRSGSTVSRSNLNTPVSAIEPNDDIDDYGRQADEIIKKIWRIFQDNDSWSRESKSSNGIDVVMSKTYPEWGKVFRLSSVIQAPRDELVQMLFERQEDMPKWSPTVLDCRVLQYINRDLYISYQLTSEQAQGMVSKRDFVNLTTRRYIDQTAILGAQACVYPQMPERENCVRGQNGPTAYIVEKIDDTNSRFTWLLNVDLKGWLPQYLINSSLATVQLTLVASLKEYVKSADLTSSYSSSNTDSTA